MTEKNILRYFLF